MRKPAPERQAKTANVALSRTGPISDIGLRMFFSDGHQRGIDPWADPIQLSFGRN